MRLVIALAFLGAACQDRPRSPSPDRQTPPRASVLGVAANASPPRDSGNVQTRSQLDSLWSAAVAPARALFDTLWAIARNRDATRSRFGDPSAVTTALAPDVDDATLTDTVVSWTYNDARFRFLVLDEDVLAEARMGSSAPAIARLVAPFTTLPATRARLDTLRGLGRLSKGRKADTSSYSLTLTPGDYLRLYFVRDSLVQVSAVPYAVSPARGRQRALPLEALRIGPHRIRFDSTTFAIAGGMLGPAAIVHTGDAEGLISVCYRAASPAAGATLVLQADEDVEMTDKDVRVLGFALGAAGLSRELEQRCADVQFSPDQIVTDRGIRLGMSRTDVERILGAGAPDKTGMVEYEARRTYRTPSGGERLFSRLQVRYRGDSVVGLFGRRTR